MNALRARVDVYRRTLGTPLKTSQGSIDERSGCVFVLEDRDGRIGRGEAAPAYWLGAEPVAEVRRVLEEVVRIISADSLSRSDVEEAFVIESGGPSANRPIAAICSDLARLPSARAAIDSACLESAALEAARSVAETLGGDPGLRLPVSAILTSADSAGWCAAVERRVREGYPTVKLKVGELETAPEIERLRRVVTACVEFDVALRIDANRAWTAAEAIEILTAGIECDAGRIEFIEEPLREADASALSDLRTLTGIPVALDESLVDVPTVGRFAEQGAMDVAVVKLARLGGPRASLAAVAAAARHGVRTAFTDSIETPVGVAAVAHTVAAASAGVGPPPYALGLGGPVLFSESGEPRPVVAMAASGPGLAVEPEFGTV